METFRFVTLDPTAIIFFNNINLAIEKSTELINSSFKLIVYEIQKNKTDTIRISIYKWFESIYNTTKCKLFV